MLVEDFYRDNELYKYTDLNLNGNQELDYMVGDIESYLDKDGNWFFKLIVLSDGYNFYDFDSIDDCIDWLFEYDDPITLYFHNLDFDMLFFFKSDKFKAYMRNVDLINSGNLTITFTVRNVTFKNSLTLFPMSLKALVGKFLHVKDEDWLNEKSNVLDLDSEILLNYCRKDVYYLLSAIYKFEQYFLTNYKTPLSLTVPSLSLKVWKKFFNPDKEFIGLSRRNRFFDNNYYFGGHTEKFIAGQKVFRHVNYYDVNSLYPSEMIKAEFINSKLKRTNPTKNRLKRLIASGQLFFCEVTIDINSENLRFFPVFDEKNKTNKYPFGLVKLKLSEVGIKFILRWGCWENIKCVHTILIGETGDKIKPFKSFVEYFYKMRKSDKGNDMIFKLLLNSLYGKFGQKLERDIKVINSNREDKPKSVINQDGICVSTYTEKTEFYAMGTNRLDIAGKITESARLTMGDYINEIRVNFGDDSVIYTDTDSIITKAHLETSSLSHLLDNQKLGFLANEIGYSDNIICLGQKMYHFYKSGKKATKGVKEMSLDDFRRVIRGFNKFENKRFSKFHALVNRGFHGVQTTPFMLRNIQERLD